MSDLFSIKVENQASELEEKKTAIDRERIQLAHQKEFMEERIRNLSQREERFDCFVSKFGPGFKEQNTPEVQAGGIEHQRQQPEVENIERQNPDAPQDNQEPVQHIEGQNMLER